MLRKLPPNVSSLQFGSFLCNEKSFFPATGMSDSDPGENKEDSSTLVGAPPQGHFVSQIECHSNIVRSLWH